MMKIIIQMDRVAIRKLDPRNETRNPSLLNIFSPGKIALF